MPTARCWPSGSQPQSRVRSRDRVVSATVEAHCRWPLPSRQLRLLHQNDDVGSCRDGDAETSTAVEVANRNRERRSSHGNGRTSRGGEGPVAVAQQNGQGTIAVCDNEIEFAVAIEVGGGKRVGVASNGNWRAGGGREGSIAVSEQNGERVIVLVCDREIEFAVTVEISGNDCPRIGTRRKSRVLSKLEGSVSIAEQDRHRAAGVAISPSGGCDVELAVAVEIANCRHVGAGYIGIRRNRSLIECAISTAQHDVDR